MGQRREGDTDSSPDTAGKSRREYEHSSGDRNTKKHEGDWQGFRGGAQRDATPGAPGVESERGTDRNK